MANLTLTRHAERQAGEEKAISHLLDKLVYTDEEWKIRSIKR